MKSLLLILFVAFQQAALADVFTGNKLNEMLKEKEISYPSGFAEGFIFAIADQRGYLAYLLPQTIATDSSLTRNQKREALEQAFNKLKGTLVCFPNNVTTGQTIAIVKKWLAQNPERWNERATTLIDEALKNAYPCNTADDLLK